MKPTSGAFTMPRFSQACLLGYTPSPQHAFQGDAAHQAQRRTWLTPNDSPGTWYTRRDYWSWTLRPFHRTVFTAHTWSALPFSEPVVLGIQGKTSRGRGPYAKGPTRKGASDPLCRSVPTWYIKY